MQLEWEDQMKDKINPPHYKNNPIQTFDAITSQFSDAEKIGAIKFNICKYIMRMGKKVETLEGARDDAGKAHWYCERLLKELTDMIKKKKPKVRAQDKDPKDLTEEDLKDLLSPGVHIYPFKPKNKDNKNDKDTK
jgi:hypothetical protein